MPAPYKEVTATIEVPKNSGIPGFVRTIERLLRLPRLQEVRIDAKGKVSYRHFIPDEEETPSLAVSFDDIQPLMVIRNAALEEFRNPDEVAGIALAQMFLLASRDRLFPLGFVVSAETLFWQWFETTTGVTVNDKESLYGLPVYIEPRFEPSMLFLCAGYDRASSLVDVQKTYKLLIPKVSP